MSLARVFRARIVSGLEKEFEELFETISVASVTGAKGLLTVSIHRPTKWAPGEYAMISHWQDDAALVAFAGDSWNQAKIPRGMEKFIAECWVHHYNSWQTC